MRDTRKTLLISGGLAAGSSAMVAVGAILFESQGETLLTGLLMFVGLAIAPIALVWFLSSAVSGRRKEALERGTNELARWTLTASQWETFRTQEQRMVAAGREPNLLNFRSGPARDGAVIFSRRAVIADEDFHDLTPGGLVDLREVEFLPGAPSCLEFAMRAQKPRGASGTGFGYNHMTLRVPIAPDDTREAMRVLAHYRQSTRRGVAVAMRNPRLTVGICLGVVAVCGAAGAWGFANAQSDDLGDWPLVAAVVGVITGIGALILAAIVMFRVRVSKQ